MRNPLQTLVELLSAPAEPLPAASTVSRHENHVLHMDNLQAMARIPAASIDFIYIDPPFASDATYPQRLRVGDRTITRTAYTDRWPEGLSSYLAFLVPRLRAMQPLLAPTGSICVHLDTHSSHYVKLALDAIFGQDRMINEIIWRYGKMSNTGKRFPQNHDTLLVYAAGPGWYFRPVFSAPSEYRARFERDLRDNCVHYGDVKHRRDKLLLRRIAARQRELGRDLRDDDVLFDFDRERKVQDDVFTDISIIKGNAREGSGYATQKPVTLLERLIGAFSPEGGTIADFFCGSGTTAVAAHTLGRRFIVADIGQAAIETTRQRLQDIPYVFERAVAADTFLISSDGRIVDFRIDQLGLSDQDAEYIRELVVSAPDLLLQKSDPVRDVFGRDATVSR